MAENPVPEPLPEGAWLTMQQVFQEILASSPEPSIAFAISGGGASGAYEAGAIEAWLKCAARDFGVRASSLRPRFIVGSSAGALNATTLLVQNLRLSAHPDFGSEIWRAISPRGASFVVGRARAPLIDVATRWIKLPYPILLAAAVAVLGLMLLLGWVAGLALGVLLILFSVVFRRAVFHNAALARTVANVLRGPVDADTGRIRARSLRARIDVRSASVDLVKAWWAAKDRPNFIVTATDLTSGSDNLFTLVDGTVYRQLAQRGWQIMQAAVSATDMAAFPHPSDRCGWVSAQDLVKCIIASTSIPGVFPSQRVTLRGVGGDEAVEHDFVDGGVLNNSPIHIAIDAGATHVISFELEPLSRQGTFRYLADDEQPNLGRNVVQTFETLLSHSTRQGIINASAWNRELAQVAIGSGKRLVPIFRFAPRRCELKTIDFDGHYSKAFSKAKPGLEEWTQHGAIDAGTEPLFWRATFVADPTSAVPGLRAHAQGPGSARSLPR